MKSLRKKKCRVKKSDFGRIFTPAFYVSVTPINVVQGFKKCGLWPVNCNVVKLGTEQFKFKQRFKLIIVVTVKFVVKKVTELKYLHLLNLYELLNY